MGFYETCVAPPGGQPAREEAYPVHLRFLGDGTWQKVPTQGREIKKYDRKIGLEKDGWIWSEDKEITPGDSGVF